VTIEKIIITDQRKMQVTEQYKKLNLMLRESRL